MTVSARRITVLDDQPQTLDLIRDVLQAEGFAVTGILHVGPDLREIRDTDPDLVIIDLLLGEDQRELSGWDVARLVRSHADLHRVPILVISADHARLRAVAGEARVMRDVRLLAKPFGVDELLAAARQAFPPATLPPVTDDARLPRADETGIGAY